MKRPFCAYSSVLLRRLIRTIPVIQQLKGLARQVWYADDAAAGGGLLQLRDWWFELLSFGHHFGYHVNAAKTWLVVKQEHLVPAQRIFNGTGIQITSAGRPYLGAPLGSEDFVMDYTQTQISQWIQGLSQLSLIAVTQPHAAYAVFVHGFSSKWNYYLRTNLVSDEQASPLEHVIRHKFLSTMVPHPPNDLERELFSLPISLGGLGICDPHQAFRDFYEFSRKLSRPLVDLILQQCDTLPHDVIDSQYRLFKKLKPNIRIRWIEHSQFFLVPLTIYVKLWNAVRRRAHLHGCLLFRLHSMVLRFIRLTSLMPCVCVMAGLHHIYLPTVSVERPLPYHMP